MGHCKTCIHTEVCFKDKNIVGDFYVAPHPVFFDEEYKKKSWENYLKWEKDGFPCSEYMELVRCKDCKYCSVDKHVDGNVPNYVCIDMDCGVDADGFCSWGERKEDADN